MKFIKCEIDRACNVIVNDKTEIEKDINQVIEEVRSGDQFSGYLFYPGDKPDCGNPIDKNVSREKYLKDPEIYGVCIYKTWDNSVAFE